MTIAASITASNLWLMRRSDISEALNLKLLLPPRHNDLEQVPQKRVPRY
jgi:hypothetical protein